jgi:magnesium transporter
MFTAYARLSDGTPRTLEAAPDLAALWSDKEAVLWIDLEQPTEEEIRAVDAVIDLDNEALDDCLHGEQRPRVDEYENYIFLVVYGLLGSEQEADHRPCKLAVFCGDRFLVTVHRESVRTIEHFRVRCGQHAAQLLQHGVDHLLYSILDGMVDNYLRVSETYEERLEELEDRSQHPAVDDSVLRDLSELRRGLLELRRYATSQMQLLEPISEGEYDYISEALGRQFAHLRDHLLKVVEQVDGLRELANGVRDNYHTALAERTNAAMRMLTVFASVLLPLSLIAGIYGMNLPLWPKADHPASFWGVIGAMEVMKARTQQPSQSRRIDDAPRDSDGLLDT